MNPFNTEVILIRGVPGSGKTTYAREHFPGHVLIEADDFFLLNGVYRFNPNFRRDAHAYCISRFTLAVESKTPVVVANTFIRRWELSPYLKLVPDATIIRCTGEYENTHGVPAERVAEMRADMETVEGEVIKPEAQPDFLPLRAGERYKTREAVYECIFVRDGIAWMVSSKDATAYTWEAATGKTIALAINPNYDVISRWSSGGTTRSRTIKDA